MGSRWVGRRDRYIARWARDLPAAGFCRYDDRSPSPPTARAGPRAHRRRGVECSRCCAGHARDLALFHSRHYPGSRVALRCERGRGAQAPPRGASETDAASGTPADAAAHAAREHLRSGRSDTGWRDYRRLRPTATPSVRPPRLGCRGGHPRRFLAPVRFAHRLGTQASGGAPAVLRRAHRVGPQGPGPSRGRPLRHGGRGGAQRTPGHGRDGLRGAGGRLRTDRRPDAIRSGPFGHRAPASSVLPRHRAGIGAAGTAHRTEVRRAHREPPGPTGRLACGRSGHLADHAGDRRGLRAGLDGGP